MPCYDKIILVTKKTALEELVERFNTRDQAAFYLGRMGVEFRDYEIAHECYCRALARITSAVPSGLALQIVERSYLPSFMPGDNDLIVTLGPDGLVVNVAKYIDHHPLLALNPDRERIDGILVPFAADEVGEILKKALDRKLPAKNISMAKAQFNDGQVLYALNDFFVGQKTHVSARYMLAYKGKREHQSSSGIIISTGAGSTGWFRSVVTGASAVMESFIHSEEVKDVRNRYRFDWESDYLCFSVREPFVSKTSSASLTFGRIEKGESLEVISQMPQNGLVFSDGVEPDYVDFNSGSIVRIGIAERALHLIVRS